MLAWLGRGRRIGRNRLTRQPVRPAESPTPGYRPDIGTADAHARAIPGGQSWMSGSADALGQVLIGLAALCAGAALPIGAIVGFAAGAEVEIRDQRAAIGSERPGRCLPCGIAGAILSGGAGGQRQRADDQGEAPTTLMEVTARHGGRMHSLLGGRLDDAPWRQCPACFSTEVSPRIHSGTAVARPARAPAPGPGWSRSCHPRRRS